MRDFITEISEAGEDLKKEKDEHDRQMKKAQQAKKFSKSHRRR